MERHHKGSRCLCRSCYRLMKEFSFQGSDQPVLYSPAAIWKISKEVEQKKVTHFIGLLFQQAKEAGKDFKKPVKTPIPVDLQYDVLVPVVRWGLWGGQRANDNKDYQAIEESDMADIIGKDEKSALEAMNIFWEYVDAAHPYIAAFLNTPENGQAKGKKKAKQ